MVVYNSHDNPLENHTRTVDSIKECAATIRDSLNKFDFDLEDSFCDAQDLKTALCRIDIPEPILMFFGHLFNFSPDSYKKASQGVMKEDRTASACPVSCDDDSNDTDGDDGEDEDDVYKKKLADGELSVQRCKKIQSIFQTIYYVHHQGRRRTPIHIMNAVSVHALGRGGKLMTKSLNREGISMSYDELRRYQCDMARISAQHNRDRMGLPHHFDPGQFTSCAIDNWDHEGENASEHDTAMVLFQDKPESLPQKPKISDTQVKHGQRAFNQILPCQKLIDIKKPVHRPDIPASYKVENDVYTSPAATSSQLKNMSWSLARLDISTESVSISPKTQTIPSWSATNAIWTTENIPQKNLAFMPVLPYPVTQYSTVYTAIKNVMDISSQLVQNEIPLYCDEGVYCIVREIQLQRPDEFRRLVPCAGTLHLTKNVLKCIGRSLSGSGVELVWLQADVFGPSVIENSVLNGGHYNRSLNGMLLLHEALERLLYRQFFETKGVSPYSSELIILEELKAAVQNKDIQKSQQYISTFSENSKKLTHDLDTFISERSKVNENFRFWANVRDMVAVVLDILRADREGIWELHLDAVQRAMYLFAAFDSTNYLRWCSLYLEDMRRLPQTAPSVYEQFAKGNFSIKEKPGRFTAVGGDQKLEQSINLSSKCNTSIISQSKKKQYITQWDLIYHEMKSVQNLHRQYIGVLDMTNEVVSHHDSAQATTDRKESQLKKMIEFIDEKGSPFAEGSHPTLQNLVTKEIMSDAIRDDLLNVFEKGKDKYMQFRNDIFVNKSNRHSNTIHRLNLKTMKSNHVKIQKTAKAKVKEVNILDRSIDVARERGLTPKDLLRYDVAPSPVLFDENNMMTKSTKSLLVQELETHLQPDNYRYRHTTESAFVIDVMANVRKVNITSLHTFEDFAQAFFSTSSECRQFGRCDFVFDIYHGNPSVKDTERKRRAENVPIEYNSITPSSALPKHMDLFWPSSRNKDLLEKLIYDFISTNSYSINTKHPIVLGQATAQCDEWQPVKIFEGEGRNLPHLRSELDEADLRILMHILDCTQNGIKRCVVLSNDTDVIVALLHHMCVFEKKGLEELWVRAGVGASTRYLPVHDLYGRLGNDMCLVLPAVHCLTGCDYTSKIGTKKAALKADPVKYLRNFGRQTVISEDIKRNAEKYLVKVYRPKCDADSFTSMREDVFHHTAGSSHQNLPPTSEALFPHIKRSFFCTYAIIHALDRHLELGDSTALSPEQFGYNFNNESQLLDPETAWKSLEPRWTVVCHCKTCSRATCPCREAGTKCVEFCNCKRVSELPCKNSFK